MLRDELKLIERQVEELRPNKDWTTIYTNLHELTIKCLNYIDRIEGRDFVEDKPEAEIDEAAWHAQPRIPPIRPRAPNRAGNVRLNVNDYIIENNVIQAYQAGMDLLPIEAPVPVRNPANEAIPEPIGIIDDGFREARLQMAIQQQRIEEARLALAVRGGARPRGAR